MSFVCSLPVLRHPFVFLPRLTCHVILRLTDSPRKSNRHWRMLGFSRSFLMIMMGMAEMGSPCLPRATVGSVELSRFVDKTCYHGCLMIDTHRYTDRTGDPGVRRLYQCRLAPMPFRFRHVQCSYRFQVSPVLVGYDMSIAICRRSTER